MTTAAPSISARIHSLNRPNLVSVGTIVWLSSELMFFAGLFAIYFTARAQNPPGVAWPPPPTHLDVPYALVVRDDAMPDAVKVRADVHVQSAAFDRRQSGARLVTCDAGPSNLEQLLERVRIPADGDA